MNHRKWIFIIFALMFTFAIHPPARGEEGGVLWVDRFSGSVSADGIPEGWILEKNKGPQSKIAVGKENAGFYLYLRSVRDNFGLRKELSFEIKKFPYLQWRWKVKELPKGGDVRKRETDDQAGQLYILFPRFPTMINTRSVGYIWDSTAPVGTSGTSTAYSKMKYVVLQSGPEKLGQWVQESRNVYEDYKKLFQEEPPTVGGLLIFINSQYTQSSADCFYADIFFSATMPKK